jgi:acyl-CoA thioesterase FadM
MLDDELEVTTWLSGVEDSTAIRHTILCRLSDGAPISRARTVHVWLDLNTGKPAMIPRTFLADLSPSVAE